MYFDHQKNEAFRKQLFDVLHENRGGLGHAFAFVLIVLILLSIALLPMELLEQFRAYHNTILIIEGILTGLFTVEYILRVYSAPKRWRYVFSIFGIIDLLAVLPFYFGLIGLQSLRAVRIIRLLRIGHIHAAASSEKDDVMEYSVGLIHGEEKVEYIVTHHAMFLFLGSLPSLIALTFSFGMLLIFPITAITAALGVTMLVFALILLWKAWLDYSYDVIYITTRRLLFQNQHLLGRSVNQVNYHAITNVKPAYTGILSYLFGYGSIMIETAADQLGHFGLEMVRGHEKAAHLIMQKCFVAKAPAQ